MLRTASQPALAPSDAELLAAFLQSRDDAAFGRLVARHSETVRRVAVRATGNPSAAEDVAQAAFIVLARRPRAAWLSARCRGSAMPWLARTARYAASTWRRGESRRRRHEHVAAAPERVDPSEAGELTEEVVTALSRMSRSERRLITLRHLDEKPWPDVADRVGMSPEAARKATARALGRLRERLARRGVIVSPAALLIALSTIARPARAATVAGGSGSAFLIARGVLTMMKIQNAGLAGTALLAAAMSVGVVGGGFGSISASFATPGVAAPAQDGGGQSGRAGQAAQERVEDFTPGDQQPTVTLADGTKLTLLAVSNGDDGWWHPDGTRARAPRHYLPRGLSSPTLTVTTQGRLLDMAFYAEGGARDDDAQGEWVSIAGVMVGPERAEPDSTGIGISANNSRAAWRVIVSDDASGETSEAWICIASGAPQKVGEVRRGEDGSWSPDEGAARWVSLGMEDKNLFLEPRESQESGAITATGGGNQHHGHVNQGRLMFHAEALEGVDRLEVFRRPLQVLRISGIARQEGQATQPEMRLEEEPLVLMVGGHTVIAAAGSHSHSTVRVGGGSARPGAEAHGGGHGSGSNAKAGARATTRSSGASGGGGAGRND